MAHRFSFLLNFFLFRCIQQNRNRRLFLSISLAFFFNPRYIDRENIVKRKRKMNSVIMLPINIISCIFLFFLTRKSSNRFFTWKIVSFLRKWNALNKLIIHTSNIKKYIEDFLFSLVLSFLTFTILFLLLYYEHNDVEWLWSLQQDQNNEGEWNWPYS